MKKLFIALLLIAVFSAAAQQTVNTNDFKPAFGKWKGSLTYLDYSSGKPYTMPANVTLSKDGNNAHQLIFAFVYPDEPKANGNDTLVISDDGLQIDGSMVVSKKKNSDGALEIITERNGVDGNDNRKAVIRHIYIISKKKFISRKEVRFDGEEKFIMRNEYKMSR
jgi:hypothetical protein